MKSSDLLARHAEARSDRPAFVCRGQTYTWREVEERVGRLAAHLAADLPPGERVAVLAHNCHRYWEVVFACARAGLVTVPINHRLSASEVKDIREDVGARGAVVDRSLIQERSDLAAALEVEVLVTFGDGVEVGRDYDRLATTGNPLGPGERDCDLSVVGFTSGTTGRARGAVLTHHTSMTTAMWFSTLFGLSEDDVFLACLPAYVYRGGAGGMAAVVPGACSVVTDFEAGRVAELIARHRVTALILAPIMADRLLRLDLRRHDLSSVRSLWVGGAPSSPRTVELLQEAMPAAVIGAVYGMTEATGISSGAWPGGSGDAERRRRASVGRPSPLVEFRLLDDDGAPVAPGQPGEIIVRGDSVMQGYWGLGPGAGLRDGWFYTGDVGLRDPDGSLFLVDRRADVIVSGGLNVYSAEVERALLTHPQVEEAVVVGAPDPEWGEAVTAVLVAKGTPPADAQLAQHLEQRLAGFKRPKRTVWMESLPRNAMGKLDKKAVRAMLWNRNGGRQIGG
jgi:acyl-CoA synthetase (AMP-forming)/AMP-acid ligase II